MVNVPHHCLVNSVRRDAYKPALDIQGLPVPGHHLKLTRHESYVCGGVVDGIQLRVFWCEVDNLEALGEKQLGEIGEVVSSEGDTRHLRACSV